MTYTIKRKPRGYKLLAILLALSTIIWAFGPINLQFALPINRAKAEITGISSINGSLDQQSGYAITNIVFSGADTDSLPNPTDTDCAPGVAYCYINDGTFVLTDTNSQQTYYPLFITRKDIISGNSADDLILQIVWDAQVTPDASFVIDLTFTNDLAGLSVYNGNGYPVGCQNNCQPGGSGQQQQQGNAPQLSGGGPLDGSVDVPTWPVIDIESDISLDPSTVNTNTVTLFECTGTNDALSCPSTTGSNLCSVSVFNENRGIECIPTNALDTDKTYIFTVTTGVTSSEGVPLGSNVSRIFRTSSIQYGVDDTPAGVEATYPEQGETGVGLNANLAVKFFSAMSTSGNGSVTSSDNIWLQTTQYGEPTGSNICANNGCTLTYDSENSTLKIDPASNLTASQEYALTVKATVTSSEGNPMLEDYIVFFMTGNDVDTDAPSVLDTYPKTYSTAEELAAGENISKTEPYFEVYMSESLDPSTVTTSNVKFFKDKVGPNDFQLDQGEEVTTDVFYNSSDKSIFIGLQSNLDSNATYCVWLNSGITDTTGNALTPTVRCASTYVTEQDDTIGPRLMFADCNNYKCWLEFDEPLDSTVAETSTNYILETFDEGATAGSKINLQQANISYQPDYQAVLIENLTLQTGQIFKFTINNLTDRSNNTIDANTIFEGVVMDATETGEYLGSQTGEEDWYTNTDMADYWENPEWCAPMSNVAGVTTTVECEFALPMAVDNTNFSVTLTFPTGTVVSGAIAPSSSWSNDDMNDWAPGVITFRTSGVSGDGSSDADRGGAVNDGVTVNNNARTVTLHLTHNGDAQDANEEIMFEIGGIINPSTPGDKTITAIVQDNDGVKRGSTISFPPYNIVEGGSFTLSGRVCKGSSSGGECSDSDAAISGATVFIESRGSYGTDGTMGGWQETTVDENGYYSFSNLSAGQYGMGVFMDPSVMEDVGGGSDYRDIYIEGSVTGEDFKFTDLSTTGKTLNVTISGPASTDLDVFCFAPNDYEFSAPMFKTVTTNTSGNATASIKLEPNTSYECGVGPAIPHDVEYDSKNFVPTFNFMPPPSQIVVVENTDPDPITFTLQSANYQIKGVVRDGSGNGIANAWVDAFPAHEKGIDTDGDIVDMQGTFTQTASDGTFTLNVTRGTYEVSACAPGMPCSQPKEVTVKDNDSSNSDGNTTADVYNQGTLLTGVGLILKMNKTNVTISGIVRDENNNGIEYGFVEAQKVSSGDSCFSFTPIGGVAESPTDANGNYTLYVDNGTWRVSAFAPAYGEVGCIIVAVSGGKSKSGQNITASAADYGTVSGTVTKDGTAVSGAHVGCFGSSGGNHVVTQSDGTYSLKLKAGTYTCDGFIEGVGQLPVTSNVVVTAGQTTTVNMSVGNPGTIQVTISGITDAFCDAKDANKRGAGTGQNSNGVYNINVPAGTYTVRCANPRYGELGVQTGVTVSAGSTSSVSFSAPTLYTVTGRVTDGTNNLDGATVSFIDNSNGRIALAQSNASASGNNVSIALPAGTYSVIASKAGYVDLSTAESLTVSANSSFTTRSLTKASASISLTVQSGNSNYTGDAKVVATDANNRVVTIDVDKTVTSGSNATLNLTDGTWTVKAFSDTGKTVSSPTTIVVANGTPDISSATLELDTEITGFIYKEPENLPLIPKNGGNFKFTDFDEDFLVEIPKNVLSNSDSNSGTLSIELDPIHAISTTGKSFVGTQAIEITPKDNAGKEINELTSDYQGVTITIPYEDADVSTAGVSEDNLVIGSWNEASQEWEILPTTLDTTNNLLVAQTTHFSTFGVIGMAAASTSTASTGGSGPTDTTPPAAPSNVSLELNSDNSITITWTDPTDTDLDKILILRGKDNVPVSGTPIATVDAGVETYTDTDTSTGSTYTYIIRSKDTTGNTSSGETEYSISVPAAVSGGGGASTATASEEEEKAAEEEAVSEETVSEEGKAEEETAAGEKVEEALDERASQIARIEQEAPEILLGTDAIIALNGTTKDETKESEALRLVQKIVTDVTETVQEILQAFVAYGTPETKKLGSGERAGVINSFQSAFGKLPETESDWQDVLKIANGRWPSQTNEEAESLAKKTFETIYIRQADMDNPNDNAAVTIMAYGLRPSDRNLDSERAAISIYKNIFGTLPSSATDWDAVRAIAYSGATR